MIDVLLITLNDEINVANMCSSILDSNFSRLIIIDGGSVDRTVNAAKEYTSTVITSTPGMAHQTRVGLSLVDTEYIFLAEADHIYPPGFLQALFDELVASDWDGIQGTLDVASPRTIWEYCHKLFYFVHQHNKGLRTIIACPQLWKTSSFRRLMDVLEGGESFCFDTQRAESAAKLELKVGLGNPTAYENQKINFSKFLRRHLNYGAGDFDFYFANKHHWPVSRKLISLTHVFRRYGFEYPLKALKYNVNPIIIPYFLLVMFVRYTGFLTRYLGLR